MSDMKLVCMELYGIKNILELIHVNGLTIVDKISCCMKFIQIAENALLYENEQEKVFVCNQSNEMIDDNIFEIDSSDLHKVILIIGRKLCIDDQIVDTIVLMNDDEIPSFAQIIVQQIFEAIMKDITNLFDAKPLSSMEVAIVILQRVFNINVDNC
eukprot:302569_1